MKINQHSGNCSIFFGKLIIGHQSEKAIAHTHHLCFQFNANLLDFLFA